MFGGTTCRSSGQGKELILLHSWKQRGRGGQEKQGRHQALREMPND